MELSVFFSLSDLLSLALTTFFFSFHFKASSEAIWSWVDVIDQWPTSIAQHTTAKQQQKRRELLLARSFNFMLYSRAQKPPKFFPKKHIEPSNQLAAHNGELKQISSLLFFFKLGHCLDDFWLWRCDLNPQKNETTKLFYRFSMQIEARSRSTGAKKKDATSPPNDDLVATFFRHRCEACDSSVTRFEFHAAKKRRSLM